MGAIMRTVITVALALSIIVPAVLAQDTEALRSEFRAAMNKSAALTANASYRNKATVEMGPTSSTTEWQPYSSRVVEFAYPDSNHIVYTSRIKGEFIQIGKVTFQTYQNGTWVKSEVRKESPITNPAAAIGVGGPNFEFSRTNSDGFDVFRIINNPEPGTKDFEKQIVTWTFWFDAKGVLFKHDSIAYNGINWVRTTEVYEYDSTIKIEAPAN
jgi:hypothetical protein